MRRIAAACVLLALVLTGCTPPAAYIEADRATFDVIAPAYLDYVREDAALDDSQRERRGRVISTWLLRLEKAEGVSR